MRTDAHDFGWSGNPRDLRRLVGMWMMVVGTMHFCLPDCGKVAMGQEASEGFAQADLDFFENKVRPILANHCYDCHGPDIDEPDGSLFVSSRKNLLEGGDSGPAIKPGHPDDSFLIQVVNYGGVIEMPPDSRLADEDIQVLRDWVERGAPWPADSDEQATAKSGFDLSARQSEHWCWQPMQLASLPPLANPSWPLQSLDRFILSKLEEASISPAPAADKSTWLRRVTFDLTGLPPTPDERDAFLQDDSPKAFERVVDRLLESPAFGEHWARHWMDLVRYAETCGHEFDYPIPHAYRYRDYLIRAFANDVPYDQLIREHIAGDRLETPRRNAEQGFNESVIGTGFWFLGEAVHAPVDVRGDEAGRIDNQIDVMTKTFLGVTVACARCHDHKFDAISTKDYYALAGFLQSSRRDLALLDPEHRIENGLNRLEEIEAETRQLLQASIELNEPSTDDNVRSTWSREVNALAEVVRRWQSKAPPTEPMVFDPKLDELVEDFESGTYNGWIAEGNAFGTQPQSQATLAKYQGNVGAAGNFFVNSHSRTAAEGGPKDDATGTLTSPEIVLTRRFLHFLVGGGSHKGQTCVDVVVDGQVVASQTGFNQNPMTAVVVDLGRWSGKTARIRIVDQATGGWGNIGADRFILSDSPRLDLPRSVIRDVAQQHGVSQARLEQWFLALHDEHLQEVDQALSPLARVVANLAVPGQKIERLKSAWQAEARQATEQHAADARSFLDAQTDLAATWFPSGQAFSDWPTMQGNWRPAIQGPGWEFVPASIVSSQRRSRRTWGVLRSPTFTIEEGVIWLQLAARDIEVRVIIDGFTMGRYNGLLFSNCFQRTSTDDDLRWVSLSGDIGRYLGHRAHLEIIDHGGTGFDVRQIRFGSKAPAVPSPLATELWEQADSVEGLASGLAEQLSQGWTACVNGTATLEQSDLVNWALRHELLALSDATQRQLLVLRESYEAAEREIPDPLPVQALADGTPENEHVFIRGNHRLLGEEAPRQNLTALCGGTPWPEDLAGSGRRRLAEEIASADNPLTARVMVNRVWHHLMGRGIVESVDNFGVLGTQPTHPELLDHLALTFIEDGWSLKRLCRRIVLSQTYRMSSRGSEASDRADPTNQLWHRTEVRRLSGEAIRDALLSVSGQLSETQFGPSVKVHLSPFMEGRGRPGSSGPLDGDGRRSLYIEIRRNFLSPMMIAFDSPIPFSTVGRRNVSNVPAQALILMNDPFVYDQAGKWAARLLSEAETFEARLDRLYLLAFNRSPTEEEREQARGFIDLQGAALGVPAEQRGEHAQVWQDLCHVLCNVKEFTYIN